MKDHIYSHFTFIASENSCYPGAGEARFLFNQPGYQELHSNQPFDQFVIRNDKDKKTEGIIHFRRVENRAISLYRATFGSLELRIRLNYDILFEFFSFIIRYYRETPVHTLIINHYADVYDPVNGPVISLTLSHAGFRVAAHDINHHLPVTHKFFEEHINKMEKRKLKKCTEGGLQLTRGQNTDIGEIYRKMISFRNRINIPVSIETGDLQESFNKFPDNYFLLYVRNAENEILAGAVLVKITKSILYYFSPAGNPAFKKISPMVFLLKGIYEFAKENKCSVIDLGVSSIDNRPQKGLIRFKDNIGGIAASRFTFQLDL